MRQLILTTNNAYDSILRVDNGRIVSAWSPIGAREIDDLIVSEYAGDWDVQDADGLTRDDGTAAALEDYGTPVVELTEDKGWRVLDIFAAARRAQFYRVTWPVAAEGE